MALGWKMDEYVRGHRAAMDRFDPAEKTALEKLAGELKQKALELERRAAQLH